MILALLKRYRDAGLGDTDDAKRVAFAASASAPVPATGLSPLALAHLREVRDEARALRSAMA